MLKTSFHAAAQEINFAQSATAAKVRHAKLDYFHTPIKEINGWVEKKTRDKIKKLIKADHLNGDTMFVLINAGCYKLAC